MGTHLEPAQPAAPAQDSVVALAARYAHNSNDVVSAYDGWQYFTTEAPAGAVAYVRRGRALIANGDPLCAPEHTAEVLRRFAAYARVRRLTCCFLGASERARAAAAGLGYGAVKVGEEPLFDLRTYAPRGDRAKKARAARNQALRSGVAAREYVPAHGRNPAVEREMEAVLAAWSRTRPVEPLAFSLRLEPFTGLERKRYFVAVHEGRVVAFVACSPLPGRAGAYLEDVIRHPDAPYGSTELLVLYAFEELARSGVEMATLGVAPLQGVEQQTTRRHRALGRVLAAARDHAGRVYRFNSLGHYKRKFGPTATESVYLLYRPARITPRLLFGLLGAFTPDGLGAWLRAGWRRRLAARRPAPRAAVPGRWAYRLAWAGLGASTVLLSARYPGVLPDPHLLKLHALAVAPAAAGATALVRARARRR